MDPDGSSLVLTFVLSLIIVPLLDVILPLLSKDAVKRLVAVVVSIGAGVGVAAYEASGAPAGDEIIAASLYVYGWVSATYAVTKTTGLSPAIKGATTGSP